MKQIFTINKPNIMKKSKYQQYCHCFIICIIGPYAFWFSSKEIIVTILMSTVFRGTALVREKSLVRGRRHFFQCRYPKVRCLSKGAQNTKTI